VSYVRPHIASSDFGAFEILFEIARAGKPTILDAFSSCFAGKRHYWKTPWLENVMAGKRHG
jgi:hypothetical protein